MKALSLAISAGVLLVVLGLVLSVGIDINDNVRENTKTLGSISFVNETQVTTGTTQDLSCLGNNEAPAGISIQWITNSSNGAEICGGASESTCSAAGSGNITALDTSAGTINFTVTAADSAGAGLAVVGDSFNLSYSCSAYDLVWAIASNGTLAISEFATWQDTVALIIAAVVILTLLFGGFGAYLHFRGS